MHTNRGFSIYLILQYIQENYQTVNLTVLAKAFRCENTYLSKYIRSQTGRNFSEILREEKMRHALEYLERTPMKISEISDAVGYYSVDHFSRTFRKVYGVTPQKYKKQRFSV